MSQGPKILRECSLSSTCPMLHVMCHKSHVTCCVLLVTFFSYFSSYFFFSLFYDKVASLVSGWSVINEGYPIQLIYIKENKSLIINRINVVRVVLKTVLSLVRSLNNDLLPESLIRQEDDIFIKCCPHYYTLFLNPKYGRH